LIRFITSDTSFASVVLMVLSSRVPRRWHTPPIRTPFAHSIFTKAMLGPPH
jgi:hypothetical protein